MKIDYADIISKANERKVRLQSLDQLLTQMPEHLAALQSARVYAASLYSAVRVLDAEARALVGEPGIRGLDKFVEAVQGVYANHLGLLDRPGGFVTGNGKPHLENIRNLLETP